MESATLPGSVCVAVIERAGVLAIPVIPAWKTETGRGPCEGDQVKCDPFNPKRAAKGIGSGMGRIGHAREDRMLCREAALRLARRVAEDDRRRQGIWGICRDERNRRGFRAVRRVDVVRPQGVARPHPVEPQIRRDVVQPKHEDPVSGPVYSA
jgi:hypothetical protein